MSDTVPVLDEDNIAYSMLTECKNARMSEPPNL
jgi:hypothetical protein